MSEDLQEKILYKLGTIEATVRTESKGVHDRLDKLNGKVYSHEQYIQREIGKEEEKDKIAKDAGSGAGKVSGGITAFAVSVVAGVVSYFVGN